MDIYKKNIISLTNNQNVIIKENIDVENDCIEIEKNKNNNVVVKIDNNGKKIYLHSKYDPIGEAQKYISTLEIKDRTVIILFSFGLGYHIRELIKRCTEKNVIYVYEPNIELFNCTIKNIDYSDIFGDERFNIVLSKKCEEFNSYLMEKLQWKDFNKVIVAIMPNFKKIYRDEVIKFLNTVKNVLKEKYVDKNTMFYFANKWSDCLNNDLKYVFNSYNMNDFIGTFKNKTTIIVSAGPSLSKNAHLLKKVKGKVLIMSAFTAAKPLIERFGVEPDFIVSVDSNQLGMDSLTENIPLIFSTTSNTEFLNMHKGKKIFCTSTIESFSPNLFIKYKKPFYAVAMGGSVACVCTDIATTFGADRIILIGQDLAYTDNKMHTEGTVHKKPSKEKKKFLVEDIFGGKVYTDEVLYSYILWFENYAHSLKDRLKIIDATEGGAKIKGTEIMPLSEAIEKYCTEDRLCDTKKILDSVYEKGFTFNEKEKNEIMRNYIDAYYELEDYFLNIDDTIELSNKLVKYVKYSNDLKTIDNLVEKLDKIDAKLDRMGYYKNLLIFIMQYAFFEMEIDRDNEQDERIYIAEKNNKFYKNEKKALEKLIPTMKKVSEEFKEILEKESKEHT